MLPNASEKALSAQFTHPLMKLIKCLIKEVKMNTLAKVLVVTLLILVGMIGLPILIGLVGVLWPVLLVIGVIIFALIFVGTLIGGNKKEG